MIGRFFQERIPDANRGNRTSYRRKGKTAFCLALIITAVAIPAAQAQPFVLNRSATAPSDRPFGKQQTRKIDGDLLALHQEFETYLNRTRGLPGPVPAFKSRNALAHITEDRVVIDCTASGDPKDLASALKSLGAVNISTYGHIVSALLPMSAISALDKLEPLHFARMAYWRARIGRVTSQGDTAMDANRGRRTFGVDGSGVTVGTLSDSFNCLNGAAAGVASGDLPQGVVVLQEPPCAFGATDEGRAMMEIVRDVAPGAKQMFHTAVLGQANFARGILDLANAGANVIDDDIGYLNEPFFQDGIISQAIDTVNGMGVAYFSAAGNQASDSYEGRFRPSGMSVDYGLGAREAHDFDPGPGVEICQPINIPSGSVLSLQFQWDQPYSSVSPARGSASDIDILVTDEDCMTILASGINDNIGGDPIEIVQYSNNSADTSFNLVILRFSGPSPGFMKTIVDGASITAFNTRSSTSFGHAVPNRGLGVGAANYRQTPRFGVSPPRIESFSSRGGIPILFDLAGNRLAQPVVRPQPGLVAPDGADTTFFFRGDSDGTGFPNFFGTSAAAPHAAGVAALLKNLDISLTPQQIYSALQGTAIDMDDPNTPGFDRGFDRVSGFGLIDTDAALESVTPVNLLRDIPRAGWRAILQ
ncbi:MAG: S8 family peptidase [Gammaproteobacteria bacterium]